VLAEQALAWSLAHVSQLRVASQCPLSRMEEEEEQEQGGSRSRNRNRSRSTYV
jgi:hypothetical protein